jgi:hypothetical protein
MSTRKIGLRLSSVLLHQLPSSGRVLFRTRVIVKRLTLPEAIGGLEVAYRVDGFRQAFFSLQISMTKQHIIIMTSFLIEGQKIKIKNNTFTGGIITTNYPEQQ